MSLITFSVLLIPHSPCNQKFSCHYRNLHQHPNVHEPHLLFLPVHWRVGFFLSKMLKTSERNKSISKTFKWMCSHYDWYQGKGMQTGQSRLDAFSSCPCVLLFMSTGRGQCMTTCLQNAGYPSSKQCCHSNYMSGMCHILSLWLQMSFSCSSSPAITILSSQLLYPFWINGKCNFSASVNKFWINGKCKFSASGKCILWEICKGTAERMLSMCLSIIDVDQVKCALKP